MAAPSSNSLGPSSNTLGERCQTHDLWHELGRQIGLFLSGVTLADVVTGRVLGRAVAVTSADVPLAAD
jgi:Rrf2 family iron-sulfur cluster assembly transcriptional regulator